MRGLPEKLSESVRRLNPELGALVPVVGKASSVVLPEGFGKVVGGNMTQGASKPVGLEALPVRFTIWGEPMGAPRQSRRDAWNPRPCVVRYREWKDKARASAPAGMRTDPLEVRVIAYLAMPASWSKRKRAAMQGQFHRVKPDGDNVFKGVADALWEQDSCIAISRVEKRWCETGESRVEVEVI